MLFVILVCLMKNLKLEFLSFVSYKRWNGSFLHFGIFRIFIDFFVNDQHSSVTLMEFVLITWVKKAKREDEVEKNQSPTSLHCQFATKTKEQKKKRKRLRKDNSGIQSFHNGIFIPKNLFKNLFKITTLSPLFTGKIKNLIIIIIMKIFWWLFSVINFGICFYNNSFRIIMRSCDCRGSAVFDFGKENWNEMNKNELKLQFQISSVNEKVENGTGIPKSKK